MRKRSIWINWKISESILDQSTAEIFLNQGEKVLTMKSYFTEDTLIHMNSELQIKVKTWLLEEEMAKETDYKAVAQQIIEVVGGPENTFLLRTVRQGYA